MMHSDSVDKLNSKTGSCIAINFASKEQLFPIPGMNKWLAEVILLVRTNCSSRTKEMLQILTKDQLSSESYAVMSSSLNRAFQIRAMA